LGSGGGKNILYLARKFPEKRFVGIDLSPTSVEVSELAAIKFRLTNVNFFTRDLTKPDTYSDLMKSSSLVFTPHCFEEMPKIFKIPLILLKKKKVGNIFY
jgi:trans-aconitate methyltransferase